MGQRKTTSRGPDISRHVDETGERHEERPETSIKCITELFKNIKRLPKVLFILGFS